MYIERKSQKKIAEKWSLYLASRPRLALPCSPPRALALSIPRAPRPESESESGSATRDSPDPDSPTQSSPPGPTFLGHVETAKRARAYMSSEAPEMSGRDSAAG